MDKLISQQATIEEVKKLFEMGGCYCDRASIIGMLNSMPSAQPKLSRIIFAALAECGVYGEEAITKFTGTLKRLGISDLFPPCAR